MKQAIKTLAKAVLKPFWRLTGPVRRPLLRKLDAHMTEIVANGLRGPVMQLEAARASLERLEASVHVGRHVVEHQNVEANMLFDGLVREIARLQLQVEALHVAVEDSQVQEASELISHSESGARERKAG